MPGLQLFVFDGFGEDESDVDTFSAGTFSDVVPGFAFVSMELTFSDFLVKPGATFSGSRLPQNLAEVARLPTRDILLRASEVGFDPGDDDESLGSHYVMGAVLLDDDAPAPVPEPATLLQFATGAAISRRVWKRRTTQSSGSR